MFQIWSGGKSNPVLAMATACYKSRQIWYT